MLHNYSGLDESHIQVFIRDSIHILEECEPWFFCCLARNTGLRSIIPKSYVVVTEELGGQGVPQVVQESTAMLGELGAMLRDIYIQRDNKIFQLVQQFADIISDQIAH